MSSKSKIVIAVLCGASFAVGFVAAPIYNSITSWDYSSLTDSAYVHTSGIDIAQLNTPSDGYHKWISPKGNLYMGIWQNGRLKSGTLITEKSVYEGELLNLSPHGYGTMYYNNGNMYRGNWVAGNKEGIGLKHNHDGSMYFGHWRAGLFNAPKNVQHKVEDRVYGIDLSFRQDPSRVNWKNLALYSDAYGDVYYGKKITRTYMQPVTFVFIKASQGIKQDPCYNKHVENARKHNVIVGSYHFFTIDDDVDAQIRNFTQCVNLCKGDLPPVLDIENEWPKNEKGYIARLRKHGLDKMRNDALKWLMAIEKHYGIKPIVYTSRGWKNSFLQDERFNEYEFWLARYHNVPPKKEDSWTFWQRTDLVYPNGYSDNIDGNLFHGNYKSFINYRKNIYK